MRVCFALLAAAILLAGQESKTPEEKARTAAEKQPQVQAVVHLKYADPVEIQTLLRFFPVSTQPSRQMKAIAVTGSQGAIAAYEEAVKRLDLPPAAPKNIEFTIYILEASQRSEEGTATRAPSWGRALVPPELEGVVKQLKAVFPFQSVHVLDSVLLRTRENQAVSASGALLLAPGQERPYHIAFNSATASSGAIGKVIRIDRLRFGAKSLDSVDAGVNADVDIKEGQQVVVGKTGLQGTEKALVLVLSAKVVQ